MFILGVRRFQSINLGDIDDYDRLGRRQVHPDGRGDVTGQPIGGHIVVAVPTTLDLISVSSMVLDHHRHLRMPDHVV